MNEVKEQNERERMNEKNMELINVFIYRNDLGQNASSPFEQQQQKLQRNRNIAQCNNESRAINKQLAFFMLVWDP
jgi:flagellar hook-length control protein FliK